jgi:hypothetical protein
LLVFPKATELTLLATDASPIEMELDDDLNKEERSKRVTSQLIQKEKTLAAIEAIAEQKKKELQETLEKMNQKKNNNKRKK